MFKFLKSLFLGHTDSIKVPKKGCAHLKLYDLYFLWCLSNEIKDRQMLVFDRMNFWDYAEKLYPEVSRGSWRAHYRESTRTLYLRRVVEVDSESHVPRGVSYA